MNYQFAVFIHAGRQSALPAWISDWFSPIIPPHKVSAVYRLSSPYGQAEGVFLSISLPPDQSNCLPAPRLAKKIFSAGRLAKKMGARIIDLGALNAAAGHIGTALARTLQLPVTNGKSFIAAAALEGSKKALKLMGVPLEEAEVLVLGATGSTGSACAQLLAKDGANYLTLVASDQNQLELLAERIFYDYGVACKIASNAQRSSGRADLIISAGKKPELLPPVEDLKTGAVFYGLSEIPISFNTIGRSDILIIDGSLIRLPGDILFNGKLDFPPLTAPAFMVEAMILALEGRFESFTLSGDIRVSKVSEIRKMAVKHGFETAGFYCRGRLITDMDIEKIKGCVSGNARSGK
ncbi:MAG: shikimate dehydrogenase [Dethiobacter sp.]|jgi:predicted amino acid dehydrogenase|nr:shikimate dehydrogenase [Dethiobacter sp.]